MKKFIVPFILILLLIMAGISQAADGHAKVYGEDSSYLDGYNWESPGTIGSTTPNTGAFTSVTDSGLTATRVPFAGTGGLLSDDLDMTFATDTLTVTKVLSYETIITDSATGNTTSAQLMGQIHRITGAFTLSLATAVAGYNACFVATTAAVFSLDLTTGTDAFQLPGSAAMTAGNKLTSDGQIGAYICVNVEAAGVYRAIPVFGVFSDGGA